MNFLTYFVLSLYGVTLFILMLYGLHRYWILFLYHRYHKSGRASASVQEIELKSAVIDIQSLPIVTIQLPLYNEMYVAERLINSISQLDYPKEKLQIQVLDDSTDETSSIVAARVSDLKSKGFDIDNVRRSSRSGFKAGALAHGLMTAKGELVAIFDADFLPPQNFLMATVPHFKNEKIGMVQTRWGHINANYSLLTRLQAIFLDGHFMLEHTARYKSGAFFNFNGTAGIWRKRAIEEAGGWSADTLTEDLDLSYRAQMSGWKFIYMPDFVCPGELPVDIHSFYSQQRRWAKGAIQVARVHLGKLWKSALPLHTKIEATVHLTANIGYLLTVLVAILLLPSLFLRHHLHWMGINIMEILAFVSTTVSIFTFYMYSQREIYPNWKWKVKDIPILMSFGIGMCLSNAKAVLEGLSGHSSDFIRTPKYNIQSKRDLWSRKTYAKGKRGDSLAHILFSLYSFVTLIVAFYTKNWVSLPFIFLFAMGFIYLTSLSILHSQSQE